MSNKIQLQTNNSNLDALITRVNVAKDTASSLPEAGGGGSGSDVETCRVEINLYNPDLENVMFAIMPVLENDKITSLYTTTSAIITNVITGSKVTIIIPEDSSCLYNGTEGHIAMQEHMLDTLSPFGAPMVLRNFTILNDISFDIL